MSEKQLKKNSEDTKETKITDLNQTDKTEIKNSKLPDSSKTRANTLIEPEEADDSEQIAEVLARVIEQKFSGPIPPPNIIAGYEKVIPGAADRIIRMAEQQSSHRQEMELMQIKAEIRDNLLGVIFAFGLGIGCLAACIITVLMVPAAAGAICGSILGVTGIGSIVTAFLKNTRRSDK